MVVTVVCFGFLPRSDETWGLGPGSREESPLSVFASLVVVTTSSRTEFPTVSGSVGGDRENRVLGMGQGRVLRSLHTPSHSPFSPLLPLSCFLAVSQSFGGVCGIRAEAVSSRLCRGRDRVAWSEEEVAIPM
ncbi:hypothetical protein Taro_004151 [Colocasia esculenta]|uniref:Uncharacterized protein n=1 Tax=Colocasia esculenta TaxID=4460 RepID=A0A843THF9_COLES|nr:hypothetical protein [Colocasia esculenta]